MSCRRLFPALILLLFSLFPLAGLGQDTDGDGMTDGWELSSLTDPLTADECGDPDEDDFLNFSE